MNTNLLRIIVVFSIFHFFSLNLQAQITVTPAANVPQLIQDKLVGQGVSVTNITPTGSNLSIGFFNGVNSNIGLDSGVVLATGGVSAVPPSGFGNNFTGGCTDADLSYALTTIGMSASSSLNNCVIVEFDFVPTSDSIQFQYVFGSIEYPGFTCSSFNDIFGFFLSGPGINGPFSNNAANLALIPGTNTPVAINTINSGIPSGGSPAMCLAANPNFVAHSIYFVNNNVFPQTVSYPGFTVPLTAFSPVQCGQTYHIKLAIADVSDGALNSAVFLKANSFTSGQVQISSQIHFGGNDSTLYETCGNATLYFTRSGNLQNPDTVLITVGGTATNGVDYSYIPDTIIFATGQTIYPLNIIAYADNIVEGSETLHLTATINNPCLVGIPSEFEISITDLPPVYVTAPPDTTICPGDTITLTATGTGGMNNHPLIFEWENNLVDSVRKVAPHITTSYIVKVTDSCGIEVNYDTVTVFVMPPIYPSAGQDESICYGDSIRLHASGSNIYSWSPSTGLSNTGIYNPMAKPTVTTDYVVTVSDGVCSAKDTITVTVNPIPVISATPQNQFICLTSSIQLDASGANTYHWSPTNTLSASTGATVTANPTSTTTYKVVGTDVNGCIDSTLVTVYVHPPLFVETYGDTSVCAEELTGDLTAFATGGNGGPYNFNWSPSTGLTSTTGAVVTATPTVSTIYTVVVTDNCGTPAVSSDVVINIFDLPEIFILVDDSVNCSPLTAQFKNRTDDAQMCFWDFGNGTTSNLCDPTVTINVPGSYEASLIVENSKGCRDTLENISLTVYPNPKADFIMDPPTTTILNPRIRFTDKSEYNIHRWHWNIGNNEHHDTVPEFYFAFQNAGHYPVRLLVENIYGCTDEITHNIFIDNALTLYVPSGFSPNEDGKNEIFKAVGPDVTYFHIQIFDRWGMKVFEANDINSGWDGTFRGRKAPQDTYVYVLEAEGGYEGSRIQREGIITLVR